jgi:hypothetical protein
MSEMLTRRANKDVLGVLSEGPTKRRHTKINMTKVLTKGQQSVIIVSKEFYVVKTLRVFLLK